MIALAKVKARLAITGTPADTPANDAVLQDLIDGATGALSRELAVYLGPVAAQDEIRHGGPYLGLRVIRLYQDPAGSSVTVSTRAYPSATWELVSTGDYVLEGRALRHASAWPAGLSNVRVQYNAGYAVGAGPVELQDLIYDLVAMRWRGQGKEGMRSETIGDYSYTRADMESLTGWAGVASRWRRALV